MKKYIYIAFSILATFSVNAKIEILDRVAIIVGEGVVLESQVNSVMNTFKKRATEMNTAIPPEDLLLEQIRERLIVEELQLQTGRRAGVRISDSELNEYVANIANQNNLSVDGFINNLASQGESYSDFREQLRKELIIQRVQRGKVGGQIVITEQELAAFIVGRSDKDNYGKLAVYRPPSSNFDGPALAEERIRNDEEVASLQTLLSQRGSTVLFGELLLVPIEDSILYVRPLYVQAEGDSTVPELVQVIVAVGEDVVMADSLQDALETLTNSSLSELFEGIGGGKNTGVQVEVNETDSQNESQLEINTSDISGNVAEIISEIDRLQKASALALADDPADWEEFGRLQAQIQELVNVLAAEAS